MFVARYGFQNRVCGIFNYRDTIHYPASDGTAGFLGNAS